MSARVLLGAAILWLAACDTPKPSANAPAAAKKPPPPPARPGAAPPPPSEPTTSEPMRQKQIENVRGRGFRAEDFVESESNRDPFRILPTTTTAGSTPQYKILLPRYALGELKLVAIIGPPSQEMRYSSGGEGYNQAKAMFLDPTGMGVEVGRGEHLSREDAKVVRIAADKGKVYLEVHEEATGNKGTRVVEKVIDLHSQGEETAP